MLPLRNLSSKLKMSLNGGKTRPKVEVAADSVSQAMENSASATNAHVSGEGAASGASTRIEMHQLTINSSLKPPNQMNQRVKDEPVGAAQRPRSVTDNAFFAGGDAPTVITMPLAAGRGLSNFGEELADVPSDSTLPLASEQNKGRQTNAGQ